MKDMTDSNVNQPASVGVEAPTEVFLPCPDKGRHEDLTECWICWSEDHERRARQGQETVPGSDGDEPNMAFPVVRADMVLSYVKELAEQLTGNRPTPSRSGDLAVAILVDDVLVALEVLNQADPFLQITAIHDAPSPHLSQVVEGLNQDLLFATAIVGNQGLLVHCEIWACDLTALNFRFACRNVANAVVSARTTLAQLGQSQQTESEGREVGPYL